MIRSKVKGSFSTGKPLLLYLHLLFFTALIACNNREPDLTQAPEIPVISAFEPDSGEMIVGSPMVYEVVVKETGNMTDWEREMIAGFRGKELIEYLIKGVYEGDIPAYDYFTGEPMDKESLQKLQKDPEFAPTSVGQLQFTEYWTFNPSQNTFRKRVQQIVLGYEDRDDAGNLLGYKAAFVVPFDVAAQ